MKSRNCNHNWGYKNAAAKARKTQADGGASTTTKAVSGLSHSSTQMDLSNSIPTAPTTQSPHPHILILCFAN